MRPILAQVQPEAEEQTCRHYILTFYIDSSRHISRVPKRTSFLFNKSPAREFRRVLDSLGYRRYRLGWENENLRDQCVEIIQFATLCRRRNCVIACKECI